MKVRAVVKNPLGVFYSKWSDVLPGGSDALLELLMSVSADGRYLNLDTEDGLMVFSAGVIQQSVFLIEEIPQ